AREHKLEVMLTQNSMDQFYGMGGVSSSVDSHKFIGGTVYRPDVARQSGRIINEVRDCHKSLDCIKNRVERTIEIHKEGKERFLEALKFRAFDKDEALEQLIGATRKTAQNKKSPVSFMLEELFEADPRPKALKIGANFAYPFRDWQGHIKLLSNESKASGVNLKETIAAAQDLYAKKLIGIEQLYSAQKLSSPEAIQKIQAALVEFAHESKLYPALKSWLNPKTIKKVVASKTVELEPVLVKSEIIDKLEKVPLVNKLSTQGEVPVYTMLEGARFSAVKNNHYKSFVEDTVEVIYQDIEPFGHVYLRIGDERFTYNWIKKTSTGKYSVDRVTDGSTGFVLRLNKDKMKELKEEIVAFYEDSAKYNVPPFDSYAPELEIHIEEKTGFLYKLLGSKQTLSYKSKSPKGANTESIGKKVKLVDDGDHAYLLTPEGRKYDVSKRGDRYFIQSQSCSSSATCVLNRFLGVEIDPKLGKRGAKHLKKVLSERGKDHFVEAIIKY
ncbi:MAG: hypothetical protein KC478_16870, partial [Bacteriovoracaceae bacterium]|nr:hypothetical protein [Bacteriovoracaceae bacterium]